MLWNVFLRLRTVFYVVSLLTTVVVGDLAQFSADPNRKVRRIDTSNWGRNRAFLSLIMTMSLLFLLPSFSVRGFSTFEIVKRGCFLSLDLGFFNLKVFYRATWGTSFGYNSICWLETSKTVLIHLLSSRARPEWRFTFGFYNFLYQLFESF